MAVNNTINNDLPSMSLSLGTTSLSAISMVHVDTTIQNKWCDLLINEKCWVHFTDQSDLILQTLLHPKKWELLPIKTIWLEPQNNVQNNYCFWVLRVYEFFKTQNWQVPNHQVFFKLMGFVNSFLTAQVTLIRGDNFAIGFEGRQGILDGRNLCAGFDFIALPQMTITFFEDGSREIQEYKGNNWKMIIQTITSSWFYRKSEDWNEITEFKISFLKNARLNDFLMNKIVELQCIIEKERILDQMILDWKLPLQIQALSVGCEQIPVMVQSCKMIENKENNLKADMEKKESKDCVVCFEKKAVGAFIPCGHKVCCMECGNILEHCPICRMEKTTFIKIFD